MDIDSLILRADEEILQSVVGSPTIRLLNLLDPGLASPRRLRELVKSQNEPYELVERAEVRSALLDLLRPGEARDLAILLEVDSRDPYESLRSMRVNRGSRRYQELLKTLKVNAPEPADETPPACQRALPEFGLFEHQRRAIREVISTLDGDRRRVLLHMPTGSGKTRAGMHVVAEMLRRREPAVVVWLAYSDELCGQAAEEFLRAWQHLGDREIPLHRHWGENTTNLDDVKDGLVVAGLSKLYAGAKAEPLPLLRLADRTSLVVIDEAHQAIAETYQFLLDVLIERDAARSRLLGLSATPGRTWNDPEVDRQLAEYFYRQKVTISVPGYPSPVDYLIEEGYLARPQFRSLTYAGGLALSAGDLVALQEGLDIPAFILRQLADDEQRNLKIIHEAETLARRHRRVILFATTAEHATLIASVLAARGLTASAVTANTPSSTRQRLIGEFKSNDQEPMILCNYGVLTTGFDAPATSAALIARPTKSLVLYSQMVGRATRGPRAGGNDEAEIVTVVDTSLPGFGDMAQAFTNWEDVW